ncbi:SRPBCC domain-containing protein [Arthrobacter sp. AL12]|uniref:SRPBCC domain-containing protein n=1 Tax=Arthrobacter sp. AL12 TaxID=3042241 RepID=UPI00249C69AB|nr:SRPBCC domain-containing protein [Arthrobacter sp. AL12]MDI3213278.1 SRPBCC domain-containing protein [Arthrobacter sp. AL12]
MDLRIGGEDLWSVNPGHHTAGTFPEIEPGKRSVFSWGWESGMDLPPGASTVTIFMQPDAGGTSLRLVREGLTEHHTARTW